MGKLATYLAAGVLISIGTLVSVLTVFNVDYQRDPSELLSEQLESLNKEAPTDKIKMQIADLSWQLNKLSATEKILLNKWTEMSTNWKPEYAAEFSKIAQNLASVYVDHGSFPQALKIYDELLERDKSMHGERSAEVARDLNNRALTLYLIGTTLTNLPDRKKYFDGALKTVETSSAIWNQLKVDRAAFNVENNNALALLIKRDIALEN